MPCFLLLTFSVSSEDARKTFYILRRQIVSTTLLTIFDHKPNHFAFLVKCCNISVRHIENDEFKDIAVK